MFTWESARGLDKLQDEVNALFSGVSGAVHEFPAVNVWGGENEAIVTAELPAVDAGELNISVMGDILTLRGERKMLDMNEQDTYHRQERLYGDFQRTVRLPYRVDAERVDASLKHGVLTVRLPRVEADKPRKIAIKAV
jgi:HSP20 family protein